MALSIAKINSAKSGARSYKLFDEKGLFLLVEPSGGKLWRLKYRFGGKERKLALGKYPETGLKDARSRRDDARKLIEQGIDPSEQKKIEKQSKLIEAANSFEVVAEEYIAKKEREGLAEVTIRKQKWLVRKFGKLRTRPMAQITAPELLAALRIVEAGDCLETARRMRSFAGRVLRYAISTGRAQRDISADLRDALTAPRVTHRAAILEPHRVGDLLRAIDSYGGQPSTALALRFAPHVFVRPGELRHAEWSEFDREKGVWSIPGRKTKMGKDHHVPLSRQSLLILETAHELSGLGQYVFPSASSMKRPLSENTLNGALRRMGFDETEMSAHGFRAMASTLLNEAGLWNPDAIERALAHGEENSVRAAYHRGLYWYERVRMAQWWSDYLDELKSMDRVVQFRR